MFKLLIEIILLKKSKRFDVGKKINLHTYLLTNRAYSYTKRVFYSNNGSTLYKTSRCVHILYY